MASEKHAGKDVIEKILAIEIEMFLKRLLSQPQYMSAVSRKL